MRPFPWVVMSKNSRASIVAELNSAREALRASERRANRATKKAREYEKAVEPIMERVRFWAMSPLEDEANAPKVLTVGQCRVIANLLLDTEDEERQAEDNGESHEV